MAWRGPDAEGYCILSDGHVFLGHVRLAILDLEHRANQPMQSRCGRYYIIFNGEIYNHLHIRNKLSLKCRTNSDTETILEGYALIGEDIIQMLDGMFAFVIYDQNTKNWLCARDCFGIKPLYIYNSSNIDIICSESSIISWIINASIDEYSINEWRIARRPTPGYSFFKDINEVMPGFIYYHDNTKKNFYTLHSTKNEFSQEKFEELLMSSVKSHELSDVPVVGLLSGGLDSAIISALSSSNQFYTVGIDINNEFREAEETISFLGKKLTKVSITTEELIETWRYLVQLRREPLSVPNEALIYVVCKRMAPDEKVVLTGEGADELLFGYDRIYRWAIESAWISGEDFLLRYGYSNTIESQRLIEYIENTKEGKSLIDFIEDFFFEFHLPGLLRRMDFASMAASKEARVPFVSKSIIEYMYRRHHSIRIDSNESKKPLRRLAEKLNLNCILSRQKIGFSAQIRKLNDRREEYAFFQNIILEELGWL